MVVDFDFRFSSTWVFRSRRLASGCNRDLTKDRRLNSCHQREPAEKGMQANATDMMESCSEMLTYRSKVGFCKRPLAAFVRRAFGWFSQTRLEALHNFASFELEGAAIVGHATRRYKVYCTPFEAIDVYFICRYDSLYYTDSHLTDKSKWQ